MSTLRYRLCSKFRSAHFCICLLCIFFAWLTVTSIVLNCQMVPLHCLYLLLHFSDSLNAEKKKCSSSMSQYGGSVEVCHCRTVNSGHCSVSVGGRSQAELLRTSKNKFSVLVGPWLGAMIHSGTPHHLSCPQAAIWGPSVLLPQSPA